MLTAFNVLSYPLLQPAPTDPVLAALQQISGRFNSFSINPSVIDSTHPVRSPDQLRPPFHASTSAIWINTLWFASLFCSLAAASIALMVKQWLFEESKGLSGTSREAARLRQYRLNSLIKWGVGTMILVPSVLLQVALFLFSTGLLVLLWTTHETVAVMITALVGAFFAFVAIVTVLPIFKSDCCYKSPQAFGALMVAKLLWNGSIALTAASFWSLYKRIVSSRVKRIRWITHLCLTYHNWIKKIPLISTWNGAEQTEVARCKELLDRHIATMAYTTTFATQHLETLHILLSDLPCDQAFSCFSDIHSSWIHLWGPKHTSRDSRKPAEILFGKPFYFVLRKVLAVDPNERDRALGSDWKGMSSEYLLSSYDAAFYIPLSVEFLSTLVHLSIGGSTLAEKTFRLLFHRFESVPTARSAVTYDAFRGGKSFYLSRMSQITDSACLFIVTAVATYNVTVVDWPAYNLKRPQAIVKILKAVRLSLQFTRLILINNAGLPREQEARIRNQSRSLLSYLTEKMATVTNKDIWTTFAYIADQLIDTCKDVSRGYEMVPEEFLDIRMPSEVLGDDLMQGFVTSSLDHLKSVIQQQRNYEEAHGQ